MPKNSYNNSNFYYYFLKLVYFKLVLSYLGLDYNTSSNQLIQFLIYISYFRNYIKLIQFNLQILDQNNNNSKGFNQLARIRGSKISKIDLERSRGYKSKYKYRYR